MKSVLEELKESRNHLLSRFSAGDDPESFQREHTEIIDRYFRGCLQESDTGRSLFKENIPFAFVGVGGYGRVELCLHSDIDVIILFGKKIPSQAKNIVEEVFYPLWDLGLDIGYGTRTIKDCLILSRDDFEVLTSMMDARFICGDSKIFLSLNEEFEKKVISKKANLFGQWLEERNAIRMETFGDATHLLEPNLKEGTGGLRDYHHVLWLARAFFGLRTPRGLEYSGILSHYEYQELKNNVRFIWLVRNQLHLLSGRKNDCLNFEYQEKIAQNLGLRGKKNLPAVEQFLGRLHSSMTSIKTLHRSFVVSQLPKKRDSKDTRQIDISKGLHLHNNEINFDSATIILSNPFLLLEIFEQRSLVGRPLSIEARRLIREFLYLVDDAFRDSEKATLSFLNIINSKDASDTLDEMFETGFLDHFIPEFGQIRDRVQFDAYHTFPVGIHILETVRHLENIADQKNILLPDIFSDLKNPETLFLAGLFHDIGKAKGKGHVRKGVAITRNILRRFRYEEEATEDILFLVNNHLLLAETATRRDLNDEKLVVQCARAIGDIKRLKMLYLLTWADSMATGPRAWNEWIANLVQELFFKVLHILEKGELATPDAAQKVKQTRARVGRKMKGKIDMGDLENFFEVMSPRYLLSTPPPSISRHIIIAGKLAERLKKNEPAAFFLEAEEDNSGGCWEITFMSRDRPGLFSDIAGVMSLNNINVLSSDIYTWRDGTAVDIFRVSSPLDSIRQDETWEKVKRDLKNTFTGKLALPYRLGQKAATSVLSNPKEPVHPPKVIVDNDSSDFFTLVEVYAGDGAGRLYQITNALSSLRLDIRIARIATKGDLIADIFYVRDLEGQKVEDMEQVEEIKEALYYQLALQ